MRWLALVLVAGCFDKPPAPDPDVLLDGSVTPDTSMACQSGAWTYADTGLDVGTLADWSPSMAPDKTLAFLSDGQADVFSLAYEVSPGVYDTPSRATASTPDAVEEVTWNWDGLALLYRRTNGIYYARQRALLADPSQDAAAGELSMLLVDSRDVAFSGDGLLAAWSYVGDLRYGTRMTTSSAFAETTGLMSAVNTSDVERAPNLVSAGLTLYFVADHGGDGGAIYTSTRATVTAPFGLPARVVGIPSYIRNLEVAQDGNTMWFAHDDLETGLSWTIYRATRCP